MPGIKLGTRSAEFGGWRRQLLASDKMEEEQRTIWRWLRSGVSTLGLSLWLMNPLKSKTDIRSILLPNHPTLVPGLNPGTAMHHTCAILLPTERPTALTAPPPRPLSPLPIVEERKKIPTATAPISRRQNALIFPERRRTWPRGQLLGCEGTQLAVGRVGELNRAVLVRRQKNTDTVPVQIRSSGKYFAS